MRFIIKIALVAQCAWIVGMTGVSCAADYSWPQWRGPHRTDVSDESHLLTEWPEGGPTQVWRYEQCGLGYSGPAISRNRLVTMGARDDIEYLICVDAASGTELWVAEIGPKLVNKWGDGPRGTPTIDGELVYGLGAQGTFVCTQLSNGSVVWKRKMDEFGGEVPNWGYTESPLVDGEFVLCTPGGAQGTVLKLHKKTGEPVWQSGDFTDGAQYASIIAIDHQGRHQYVQLTQQHVVGLAAEDGAVLWKSDWPGQTAVIPTPIFRDGHVYVTSGYGVGCKRITLGPHHEVTEDYNNKNMKNHHGGVVLLDGHLYGHSDQVGWMCQNFDSGEVVWRERDALEKGSLTCAGGMLYCLGEGEGHVTLVRATPEGWQEKGRFTLTPQTKFRSPRGGIWTHPVVVNGRLYLRDQELLFCFDVRQK